MTDRQINNRITKLQGIEAQMKELEAQAEATGTCLHGTLTALTAKIN